MLHLKCSMITACEFYFSRLFTRSIELTSYTYIWEKHRLLWEDQFHDSPYHFLLLCHPLKSKNFKTEYGVPILSHLSIPLAFILIDFPTRRAKGGFYWGRWDKDGSKVDTELTHFPKTHWMYTYIEIGSSWEINEPIEQLLYNKQERRITQRKSGEPWGLLGNWGKNPGLQQQ